MRAFLVMLCVGKTAWEACYFATNAEAAYIQAETDYPGAYVAVGPWYMQVEV